MVEYGLLIALVAMVAAMAAATLGSSVSSLFKAMSSFDRQHSADPHRH
jgi:Flp pilus assembly pilin Flp